ncbi:hypothetical protein A3K73_09380 [Candidatus Pacearchaeota archaeon RBG_13_36_9]|nr:MAG: hypothetical protein A3K73_09380 [Candidatus Pacearchaeota archaeon RBG_13_36_9]
MPKKIRRLAKRFFGRRKYSGTVFGVAHITTCTTRVPFTLYTIKTNEGRSPIVRGSIRGDYTGHDNSLRAGYRVEVTLGKPSDGTYTRTNTRRKYPDGSVRVVARKVEWPPIIKYRILEEKLNEDPANTENARREKRRE